MYRSSRKKRDGYACRTMELGQDETSLRFPSLQRCRTLRTQQQLRTPPSFFGSYCIQHSMTFVFLHLSDSFFFFLVTFRRWEDEKTKHEKKKSACGRGPRLRSKKPKKKNLPFTDQSLSLIRKFPSEIHHQSHTEWSCNPKIIACCLFGSLSCRALPSLLIPPYCTYSPFASLFLSFFFLSRQTHTQRENTSEHQRKREKTQKMKKEKVFRTSDSI